MIRLISPKKLSITDDPSVCWSWQFVPDGLQSNLERISVIEIQAADLSDEEVRLGVPHNLIEFEFVLELVKSGLGRLFWIKAAFQPFTGGFPRHRVGVFANGGALKAGDHHEELVDCGGQSFYVGVAQITPDNFLECVSVAGDNLRTLFVFADYPSSRKMWGTIGDRILAHFRLAKTITIDSFSLIPSLVDSNHTVACFGRGPFDRYLNFNLFVCDTTASSCLPVLNRIISNSLSR